MKKSKFERELSSLEALMQQDLKEKERKQIIKHLRSLIDRADKYADRGTIPRETGLRIRIDLLHLIKEVKADGHGKDSSINRLQDLTQHVFSLYRSRPKSKRGASPEEKLMSLLFRSFER